MNSFVCTSKNVKWRRLLWAAVYVTGLQSAGCVMCENQCKYQEHRPVAYYYRQHSYQAIDFMRCGDHNSYTKSVQHKTEHQEIYGKPFSHLIRICRYLQLITDICN